MRLTTLLTTLALGTTAFCGPQIAALAGDSESVAMIASRDGTLYDDPLGFLTNSAGDFTFVGRNRSNNERRTAIGFDLPPELQGGVTITSVSLRMRVNMTNAPGSTITMHKLLGNWTEGTSNPPGNEGPGANATPGDVSWLHRSYDNANTDLWDTPGGDFLPAISASSPAASAGSFMTFSGPGMVADVQDAVDAFDNGEGVVFFSWLLQKTGGAVALNTRESTVAPVLTITYEVAAEPCPCDWNTSGTLNDDDFFAFLGDFFGGAPADFNGSGTTNDDDFFAFLGDYFGGVETDFNASGTTNDDDFFGFLSCYFNASSVCGE